MYVLQRFQDSLVFNPTNMPAVAPLGAFNAAVSFMTNTNWQWYSGEVTMSHLTQMVGLAVQNFVSAAAGMAVVVAIIRGIVRRGRRTLGNFWVDLTRTTLRILLPLSFVVAILLSLGGVVQNFRGLTEATPVDGAVAAEVTQSIPGGPVASQIAIKQLGTNGGGFFNTNSAHPFENSTPITNFIEMWAILIIPLALVVTYGVLVGSKKQARVLLAVMVGIWLDLQRLRHRRRVGRQPQPDRARRRPGRVGRAGRRQPRRQGGPLRAGVVRAVGRHHDRARRTAR